MGMPVDSNQDSSLFKPLAGKRVFEEIYEQIRELIFSKTLKPGDKLPGERELAVRFKTGRISVREAFRMLEQCGLIYIKQGSEGGAFVTDVDASLISRPISDIMRRSDVTLEDLTEVRLGIEALVLDLATARISDTELEELDDNIRRAEATIAPSKGAQEEVLDRPGLAKTNTEFHLVLARATRNPLLAVIVESLLKVTEQFFVKTSPLAHETAQRHVEHHKAIYKAVKEKRASEAKQFLKRHSRTVQQDISEMAEGETPAAPRRKAGK
jgi:GntR family transcriptional regulator, transcriptional repressor for pyruvate dehydrogenase complex